MKTNKRKTFTYNPNNDITMLAIDRSGKILSQISIYLLKHKSPLLKTAILERAALRLTDEITIGQDYK